MIDNIKTGDILFLSGKTWLAEQIKKSQLDKGNEFYYLNHCGIFVWINGELCVAEEDYPGQFKINRFEVEYLGEDVYHGQILSDKEIDKDKLFCELLDQQSEERLTNYGYLDILAFKVNSLWFKWTGKEVWIGRKKNKKGRYTCSQRTAKYLQDYWRVCVEKNYLEYSPADIADDTKIFITKI